MKATKRFLSAIMAMAMACGTAVTVYADGENTPAENAITAEGAQQNPVTQNAEGAGTSEGWVETNIMRVVIPTTSLDFQVDAHGLIKKSFASGKKDAQKYNKNYTIVYSNKSDATGALVKDVTDAKVTNDKNPNVLDDGFVFFTIKDPKAEKYTMSNHIDLVLENKGTYAVDIKPTLSYEQGSGTVQGEPYKSTVSSGKGLAFNIFSKTPTSDGKSYTYTALTANDKVSAGDAAKYYITTYSESTGYKYSLDDAAYAKDTKLENKAIFTIEGFSDKAAFDTAQKTPGGIKVVWSVTKHTD